MTTAVAAARARASWARVAVSADVAALFSLAVFTVFVAALTWRTWGDLAGDTGHDFVAGTRFAHGELPYVNENYYYGPLAPALLGLAARIGGGGVDPFIVFGLVVSCAIVFATYALARMYVGPQGAFLAGAITVPVAFGPHQFSFVLPHTSAATLGTLCLLLVLLALSRFAAEGRDRWLAAAGGSVGLATLTKPEFALAAVACAGVWLVLRSFARSARPREWVLVVGPALALPAAVYGAFLTRISLHRLLFQNLDPRDFLHAGGNSILKAHTPFTVSSFVQLGAKLVLYAGGVAALLLISRLLSSSGLRRRTILGVLALAAVAAAAAAVKDPEALRHGMQFAYGWIPAGAAVCAIVLLRRYARARAERTAATQVKLASLVALAVLAGTNYAAFYAYSWKAQMATYAVPLAAVFLARLHLVDLAPRRTAAALGAAWLVLLAAAGAGLTLKDARAESASVRGPGGTLNETPALAVGYQLAVDWITKRTKPGEPILLAPQMTWMYSLTDRVNPLPDINLLPGTLVGPGKEQAAIARLQADRVRLAVVDRHSFVAFGQTSFGASFDAVLDRWIRGHFHRVAAYQTGVDVESPWIEIWVRSAT